MTILQHWRDVPAERVDEAVIKAKLQGTGAALIRVEIKAGTKAPRHAHGHEQFVQVLTGSGMLETSEGRKPFEAGSLFHFPPNTWHAADFETDTVLIETNLAPA